MGNGKGQKAAKPLTMTVNEMKAKVEAAIAESALPAFFLEPIFCNYWMQLRSAGEAYARAEKERYEKETAEEKEEP